MYTEVIIRYTFEYGYEMIIGTVTVYTNAHLHYTSSNGL
jgi:hypothetical protein